MLHENYKLRDLFPLILKESSEILSAKRNEHNNSVGRAGESWAEYKEPSLTAYCPDVSEELNTDARRITVVICPGGAYEFCSFREAEPIALAFNNLGYNAFVLNYSVAPQRYPQALLELSASVSFIRNNSKRFHADPEKIIVCGFSAGGHLAASLGVFWNENFIKDSLGIERGANRPDGMILGYPVITSGDYAHKYSFECLLGKNASPEQMDKMSLEKHVCDKTPPAFIWHTFSDDCVPVENSLLFANAMKKYNIPFELHIFPEGGHGLSLCTEITSKNSSQINPHCANWFSLCHEWLELNFR